MAWKDIKEQRKSGKSSWADVKRSRGIGDGDTSEDGVSRLVGSTKINTKDLTRGRTTNTSPITVDPKVVIEAKQNRYRVPDATSDPDFEKYSTLGNRKQEAGKIKIGPVEIKSGFNRLDNSEDYMQPGEKKIYDYWIGKGDKESATKFLKGLEPEINRRRAFKEDQMMTDITRNSKAAGVAMELTTNLAAPIGYLPTAKDFITGEDIDPNSPAYMAARATNSIENELFRESSEFTKFLGQTGLSMGKFATALPFGQVGALTIMSSGAAGSTAWDATNRGASTNEAMMLGTAAGITEYLTEKLPVDNLFRLAKSGVNLVTKEGVKQVLKQAGIEGTEEVVSQYVNTLTDIAVMGSRSNYERYKAELVASGLSIEEAESQAKIDMFIKEPAIAFAGGALSGGVFGAGAGAVSTYNVSKVGSQMRGLGIEQDIIDTGLESGAETGSNQTATKVADIMKAGGKVSNYDIGKLYYENINAVNAENDEAQRKGIERMLRDAGVTEAEPISRVMQKAFSGDPLSNTEAEAIITNEAARNMFTSFTGQDIPIGTMSSMRRAVKGFSENVVKGIAQPILIQPNEAQVEPQPEANVNVEQPVAAAPKMNVQPQQTMERPLSREEIKAQVSKFGQAGAKSYGVNLKGQQDINKYTAGFSAYYIAGRSGLSYDDTMKANSNYDLPDTVKFSAYSAGQNDAKTDTKSKPVYSKEAGLKQTEESKDIKKNVAKVLDSIGKATGVKIVMVKSIDVNGEKAAANGLYMNGVLQIASDADNPVLVVAKHEVTHRLQETSPEAYKEYKDYVVQVMIKQGTLAANMKKLDILYKKRGVQMSHDKILDEIVANFTEQILTDVDAINDLVQTNRTLAQQILDMLREFMATIKEAIGKVDPSVRNQLGFNYDELKKAEALWVKALKTAEEGEATGGDGKFSLKDSDAFAENRAKAIEKFGTTTNFNEAGYLLPDGKMLDFSGKKESGVPNVRWMDHRDIQDIYDEIAHTDAMNQFISEGNIRMMPESPGLDMAAGIKPTEQQLSVIEKYINKTVKDNYFSADLSDKDGNVVASLSYDGKVNAKKVISDIQHYYNTGNIPRKSELDQFRYSLKDSEGNQLTKEQAEFFKDSKVRDADGNLIPMYHTTYSDFTVFDKSKLGANTDDNANYDDIAQTSHLGFWFNTKSLVGRAGKKDIKAYLNITRPYEVYDMDDLIVAMVDHGGDAESFLDWLKWNDYDGIRMEKDWEFGGTSYVAFEPNQIKSVDNLNPTTDPDIRFSLKEDSEGQNLSEEQAEFFKDSKVRDADGNLLKMYHGTNRKFTTFKEGTAPGWGRGIYLTDNRETALDYGESVMEVYADLRNPYMSDTQGVIDISKTEVYQKYSNKFAEREAEELGWTIEEYLEEYPDPVDRYDLWQEHVDVVNDALREMGYDGIIATNSNDVRGLEVVVFGENKIKSVDNLNPTTDPDIRYSIKDEQRVNGQMETDGDAFYDEQTESVFFRYSLKSFKESNRRDTYNKLIKSGNSPAEAMRKMSQLYSVARLISADKMLYDFQADRDYSTIKDNSDYGFSFDANSSCVKRQTFQHTMEEILKEIKDRPIYKNDYLAIRQMLKNRDYQVGCGICFVDGQRMKLGEMAEEFFEKYPEMKEKYTYYDLMSEEGHTKFKAEDPKMFSKFITLKGSQNRPKPFEPRTDYRNELIKLFYGKPDKVKSFNEHGGFRMLSSSDFEFVHMLDFMQVITDAEIVGFMGQAYTKVPQFVEFAGRTGVMINMSMIAKGSGVDADGNLIYDDIEGMPKAEMERLRAMFPRTAGNILVGANTNHILTAMASDEIDFIIPFHRSGLSKADYEYLGLRGYADYQNIQGEKVMDPETGNWRNPKTAEEKALIPKLSDWWDYGKTGEENAQAYLDLCEARGLKPAFVGEIGSKSDGTSEYVDLARDENGNVRKGYWKVLIDTKMYDNDGKAIRQGVVKADFDMDMIRAAFNDYDGDHNVKQIASDVVDDYVNQFRKNPPTKEELLGMQVDPLEIRLSEMEDEPQYSLKGESDILKQNAELKEMNDYLKAQMELTSNVTADRKKTEAYGKSVLREYSSYMDREEFISELHSIYNDMSQEQVDFDSVMGRARDLSSKVIEQASVLNDDMYKRYKELIDNVRTTPLAVQDIDKKEISYIVGDYNEFRKKNMGTLNLVKPETGGSSVDTYYQELVETYPEFFDEDIVNQGEQLVRIRNVVESLRPYRENPHSDFMDEAAEYLAQDLIDNFFEIPQTRPTFADKQQKRVDKERIKAANQRRNLREKQKARIEQIKSQHRDKTKELIAAEKEKRAGEVVKLKEKFKQKEQTKNQKISDRQLRLRIQRLVKEMNAKLLSPTDKHHVPEGLRKPVAEFLKSIDFSTDRQKQGTRNKLANLNLAYSRIAAGMDRGDSEYYLDIDPDLINMISDLQETIGDKRVVDMNSDELMKLWQITRIVRSSINNYNKLLASGLREEVVFKGESVLEDLRKSKDKTESGYDMIRKIDNMVNLDMVAPADYFEMLGDTMYDLYGNLRRGLDKKVENTKTITDYMKKLLKDQDIKTWTGKKAETTDFTLKSGKKITLTPAQVMSLYLLEKRDQARGHIYGGGIKHAPIVTKKKGKTTITKTFEPARVTPEDVSMIIGNLTAEQKKIADGISEFLNTYTSDWGNEVSMALYGYKKFTEKNYFPIKSDDNYLVSEFGMPNDSTLRSKGFTKALTKGANNPIIIDDIFDVFAKITDDSSSYNAFVLPLSDLQKVVNYKGLTGTVKQAIEKRYGTKGVAYFGKLMQDINGGIRTEVGTELVKTLLSNFKAATMGLNIRVIVQQPTALIRATAMIDPKYLAAGVVKKGDWKKVTQYSQIAQWKSWGYFSMDIGKQMKDIVMGETEARDWFFKPIQAADNMAWGKLWNAVELETKDRHPNLIEGTDMFYEMVAKRFNDIVDRTQVVDTVLHRPQILRSNDTLVKVYTSFMGEPLKSFNMLRTNIKRAVETGTQEDKERAVRTSVAWLSSMLVNVLIVSLIDIYRGKGEDEDEFLEKYAKLVGGNALNDAIGMFPFVRDIVSMANGFSPKRMDLEGLNDVTNATKRLGKAGSALLKGEPVENTPLYILKDTASAFSKLLGIPLKNVFREIESASNLVIDGFSAYDVEYALTKSMYNINHSENRGKFVDIMYKAMMEDDMESAKRIYNDMLVNGVSKSYIEYGYKTRQRKTLDGTSEIELVNDLVQKWNKTPESERTEAMKKEFESQAKAAYESLVEQGYTEEEVTKAVKRLKVPDKTMTMKELLKLYDAAKKDKAKQQEFYEAANRMIDAGYDEEDILAAIEVHKE